MISCTIDQWLRGALTGYGLPGLVSAFSVLLLLLAARKMRREHLRPPLWLALAHNAPALAMLLLGLLAGITFLWSVS